MRIEFADAQVKTRTDVMGRIDRLDNALSAIRDDIGVNMHRADRAHAAADGTREELRSLGDQVNAMARQIQRLRTEVRELKSEP
jgi:uncharacterized coiled-coil DUF342 family protein